jgi:hypothetical protein
MKAQLYTVKISGDDYGISNLAAGSVYLNDMTEDIIGFVVEDSRKTETRTICLFQPTTHPDILNHTHKIIADELDFSEIRPLVEIALNNADETSRGVKRAFWEQILDQLESQRESMAAPRSLSDILTKRI